MGSVIKSNVNDLPRPTDAEICLIGSGGGYGESIVVHLGGNNWIVVDSCINPLTGAALPLEYLESIGVDLAQVKLIVCTHWHDDHIRGISQVLDKCFNAVFSMAQVNDRRKFLRFVSLDFQKLKKESTSCSTFEYNTCLDIMAKRKTVYKVAGPDRVLLNLPDYDSQVISLSPSDLTIQNFDLEISALITNYGRSNKKIINFGPNSKSVVLLIRLGQHTGLLGADLEITDHPKLGWLDILDFSQLKESDSTLYKIAHHGSENAHSDRIWNELLERNPVALLSPWNRGSKLPTPQMLTKFVSLSNSVYITNKLSNNKGKAKRRDRDIAKTINQLGYNIEEIKFSRGMIRARIDLKKESAKWEVKLFDAAVLVN